MVKNVRGLVMKNLFYLLNMTVSGIKCIENDIRLDFYKKTIDKEFNPDRYRVKAIYGENGSGKSAIVTAVKIFQDIIFNNQYLNETHNQKLLKEMINKKTNTYKFECEFLADIDTGKMIYNYQIEIGKNENDIYEIKHEHFRFRSGNYVNSRYKTIFETKNGELKQINCDDNVKEKIEKMTYNLLNKSSFMGTYFVGSSKEKVEDVKFLVHMVMLFTFTATIKVYLDNEDQHELYFLRKVITEAQKNDRKFFKNVENIMDDLNVYLSVNDNVIKKNLYEDYIIKIKQLSKFIRLFKKDLVDIKVDTKDDGDQYRCELNLDYGDYVVNKEFESTGIKKLIKLYDCFDAAASNGIVFIDEMDSNLNDIYLCKLVEYFMYYGRGQLCFTTHNLDPMTVLKENKNSIDFLSNDNHLVSWASKGNASPENYYKNGMIEDSPFNIEATDFIGMFGE